MNRAPFTHTPARRYLCSMVKLCTNTAYTPQRHPNTNATSPNLDDPVGLENAVVRREVGCLYSSGMMAKQTGADMAREKRMK